MNTLRFFKTVCFLPVCALSLTSFNASAELIETNIDESASGAGRISIVRTDSNGNETDRKTKTAAEIEHDRLKGKYPSEYGSEGGLKLEGVSRDELEDLYFGTKIQKNMNQ